MPPRDTKRIRRLMDRGYYLGLVPGQTISDLSIASAVEPYPLSPPRELMASRCSLARTGWLQTPPLIPEVDRLAVLAAIRGVMAAGLPPIFAAVYDAPWRVFSGLHPFMQAITDPDYWYTPYFWIWWVGADEGESGWCAHRDQTPHSQVLGADGWPNQVVYWLALDDVQTDNACIYALPCDQDPNYPDNRACCDIAAANLSSIRSLPVPAGTVLAWHGGLLHWSGPRERAESPPRVSMVIITNRFPDKKDRSRHRTAGEFVDFDTRLGVVTRSLTKYGHAYADDPDLSYFAQAYGGLHDISEHRDARSRMRGPHD